MQPDLILLAEDDPTDARFFKRALGRLDTSSHVIWHKNGQDAYRELQERSTAELPRLAILDIKMPGMNGLELLAKIKSDERTRDLPIIMMSSSDEPRDIARAYGAGANGYLVKPNRFQELKELVSSIHHFWIKKNRVNPQLRGSGGGVSVG